MAAGSHVGDNTHSHDQFTSPASLSTTNMSVSVLVRLMPQQPPFCLFIKVILNIVFSVIVQRLAHLKYRILNLIDALELFLVEPGIT